MTRRTIAGMMAALLLAQGCRSLGPRTIVGDRFEYSTAIATSQKEQMLLNIVRLRYLEMPVFMELTSVINNYSFVGQAAISAPPYTRPAGTGPTAGFSAQYSDRPTITYAPLQGDQFTKSILTPIPPSVILSLMQAGWAADFIFALTVKSINGISNQSVLSREAIALDPRFEEATAALRRIQLSNAVGLRVLQQDKQTTTFIVIPQADRQEITPDRRRFRELLKLDPARTEFRLTYGTVQEGDDDVAIMTRSMIEMLGELGAAVEAPEADVQDGRVFSTSVGSAKTNGKPILTIHSSEEPPADAVVSIRFRNHWFFIDDRDLISKRTFVVVMLMMSLAESGESRAVPLLTVPSG